MEDTVKQKKRWFFKAALIVLLCLVVLLIIDLKTNCVPRAAAGALRQVVKVAPNCEYAYELLSDTYNILGCYEEAYEALDKAYIVTYKKAIEADPNDAQARFDLAQSYHYGEEKNLEQAIEHSEAAVQIEPNWAGAWLFFGQAHEDVGHYHKALEAYEEALKIDPEDSYAKECLAHGYLKLGISHEKIGRDGEAQTCFQKAIQIDPSKPTTLLRIGKLNCGAGNWTDAIECYKLSIKLKPNNPEAHYNLGEAYLKIGNKYLALKEYEILKTLDEDLAKELLCLIEQ